MILFLHHRYRTPGGEEAAVEAFRAVVREQLDESEVLLTRDSGSVAGTDAARGLLRGGIDPAEVHQAVQRSGARVVHAHNLLPTWGWRALRAARSAGARTVLHLHNYRLVCATGVCFRDGEECTACHGRNTLPGLVRRCRGGVGESLVYAAGLALSQRRLLAAADVVIVPSTFAAGRLTELGVPLGRTEVHVIGHPVVGSPHPVSVDEGSYGLVVSRLSPEKGVDVAIDACAQAGVPLLIAGDGPQRAALELRAAGADVRFLGALDRQQLAEARAGAGLVLVPSRSAETFGLAAAEAMADGLPVVGSAIGALPELLAPERLVPAGDVDALAAAITQWFGDVPAGIADRARVGALTSPDAVATALARVYGNGP